MIGERTIDMLVDDVEDHRDTLGMAGVGQRLQSVRTAERGMRREIVQRPVSPIEIELRAGDWHQFEAIDPKALEIDQPIRDAGEGVVELLDLQLVGDQVIKFGGPPAGVAPLER